MKKPILNTILFRLLVMDVAPLIRDLWKQRRVTLSWGTCFLVFVGHVMRRVCYLP